MIDVKLMTQWIISKLACLLLLLFLLVYFAMYEIKDICVKHIICIYFASVNNCGTMLFTLS